MSWVERAEAALRGGAAGADDVFLRGQRPPLLDAEGLRAVAAPFMAAVVWSAAIFREMVAGTSVDPMSLALRLIALGFTLRVLVLGARMMQRLRIFALARQYALVLTPEGMLLRTPEVDVAVPREQVVGVSEHGRWQDRPRGRRSSDVYVVTDPESGRTHVVIPPVFEETPGRLAERLMRWRGGEELEPREAPPPHALASAVYDDAAAGKLAPGVLAVRHGRGGLKKGPYLVVLLAIAAADGIARGGPNVWRAIDPLIGGGLVLVLFAVFARWLWMERRDIAPQKGLSMVLTPSELLIRMRTGILRTRWRDLASVSVAEKRAWSVLEGVHEARKLVISRRGAGPITYEEPYLGLPVEVAQILIEAYAAGRLPSETEPSETEPSEAEPDERSAAEA